MRVALTGATGFIGSHILAELQEHGHEVTALIRDDAQAGIIARRGATPSVVNLYDRPTVVSLLSDADGAIHTASPGDETSANLDAAVVDAAIEAFAGTGRPYLHISGTWIYGDNDHITEESPVNAPALVSWKEPIDRRVLEATGEEARRRLGDYFAEVLLLDQSADAARARAELDWHPSHAGLVDELRNGSYRNGKEQTR